MLMILLHTQADRSHFCMNENEYHCKVVCHAMVHEASEPLTFGLERELTYAGHLTPAAQLVPLVKRTFASADETHVRVWGPAGDIAKFPFPSNRRPRSHMKTRAHDVMCVVPRILTFSAAVSSAQFAAEIRVQIAGDAAMGKEDEREREDRGDREGAGGTSLGMWELHTGIEGEDFLRGALAERSTYLLCCNVQHEQTSVNGEMKVVQLTSDVLETRLAHPVHLLTEQDSFDVTVSPRAGAMGEWTRQLQMTPRQHDFRDRIQLPRLLRYPLPPDALPDEPEDKRRATLLRVFQAHTTWFRRWLMPRANRKKDVRDSHVDSPIFYSIMKSQSTGEGSHALVLFDRIDQGSGCIIEFPLSAVSKVYRIVKNDDRWFSAGTQGHKKPGERFAQPLPRQMHGEEESLLAL
eukprot:s2181_g13.t1